MIGKKSTGREGRRKRRMRNNIPSFNYEEAVKESPREAARWHFKRKPYGAGVTSKQKDTEESKDSDK